MPVNCEIADCFATHHSSTADNSWFSHLEKYLALSRKTRHAPVSTPELKLKHVKTTAFHLIMENSTLAALNTTCGLKWHKTEMWKSGSYSCKIIDCTKLKLIIAPTDKMTTPIMLVFLMNVCTFFFFFFTKMNVWWDMGVPVKHRGSQSVKSLCLKGWFSKPGRQDMTEFI